MKPCSSHFEAEESLVNIDGVSHLLSVGYVGAMGVCGLVLVSLASNLNAISNNMGFESTSFGSVFIARGIGSTLGSVVASSLFSRFDGNWILSTTLISIQMLLLGVPFVGNAHLLVAIFLVFGLATSITDTGVQIQTRKLHGSRAGFWLGCNTVSFGCAGALVPLFLIVSDSILYTHILLSIFVGLVALVIYVGGKGGTGEKIFDREMKSLTETSILRLEPFNTSQLVLQENHGLFYYVVPQSPPPQSSLMAASSRTWIISNQSLSESIDVKHDKKATFSAAYEAPHYRVEVLIAFAVFFCIGGSVALTAYLDEFLDVTKIIGGRHKSQILFALWMFITFGRILGVLVQRTLKNSNLLVRYIALLLAFGSISLSIILIFPHNYLAFIIGVCGYGLSHGPCIGFIYDLNNRLTFPTEKSTSIVMFGLNLGTSIFPFFTSYLWKQFGSKMLVALVLASTSFPLPLIYIAYANKYQKSTHVYQYNTLSSTT